MHFTHLRLKPTQKIKKDFDFQEALKDVEIPEESKKATREILKPNKLSDDLGYDLLMEYDNSVTFGFDIQYGKKKIVIPELNPTVIFYSNAVMCHRNLIKSKNNLINSSPTLKKITEPTDPKLFGTFFQFAVNCIINLQATVESFVNREIPLNYNFEENDPTIFFKLDNVLPRLKGKKFGSSFRPDNKRIRQIIEIRNKIVHITPENKITNTQYKSLYRDLLNYDFTRAINSVRRFIEFYEPDLIEECSCGKEYFFEIQTIEKP